jgi:energy-coupling factor transporter ATP-binding protein EcfA2
MLYLIDFILRNLKQNSEQSSSLIGFYILSLIFVVIVVFIKFNLEIKYVDSDNTICQIYGKINHYVISDVSHMIAFGPFAISIESKLCAIGWLFMPSNKDATPSLYLISTHATYLQLLTFEKIDPSHQIINLMREGNYWGFSYYEAKQDILYDEPRPAQAKILDEIMSNLKPGKNLTTVITGTSGSGKTSCAQLLTAKLNKAGISTVMCDSWNPFEQGNTIRQLVKAAKGRRLVILLDEFDVDLKKIHAPAEKMSYSPFVILIHNKTTWNKFLDRIHLNQISNIILIMTSNLSRDEIIESCDKDISYLADHRVNMFVTLEPELTPSLTE